METEYYNVVIDGRNLFDQPVKNGIKKIMLQAKQMITKHVF